MRRFFRNTSVALLIAGYGAGAHSAVLQSISLPVASTPCDAVKAMAGRGKEPKGPVWTQRRHLPLVHQNSLSPAIPPSTILPDVTSGFSILPQCTARSVFPLDYFSSGCNKAPPEG